MDKGPLFHAHIAGRQASHEPAQQGLQQAEALQQSQSRQHALEQKQQQTQQQEQAPKISMAGHDEAFGLELSSETDTP